MKEKKENILTKVVKALVCEEKDPMVVLNEGALLTILFEDGYTTCEEFKEGVNLIGINMCKENGELKDKLFINIYRGKDTSITGIDLRYGLEYHTLKIIDSKFVTTGYQYLFESVSDGFPKNIYKEYTGYKPTDSDKYYDYCKCVGEDGKPIITSKMLMDAADTKNQAKSIGDYIGKVSMYKKCKDTVIDDMYETLAVFIPMRKIISVGRHIDDMRIKITYDILLQPDKDYAFDCNSIIRLNALLIPENMDNVSDLNYLDNVHIWNESSLGVDEVLTLPYDQKVFIILHGLKMHIAFKDGKMSLDSDYIAEQFDDVTKKRNLDIISAVNSLIENNKDKDYEEIYEIIKTYFDENKYSILNVLIDLILASTLDKTTDKVRIDLNSMADGVEGMRPLILKAISDYDL